MRLLSSSVALRAHFVFSDGPAGGKQWILRALSSVCIRSSCACSGGARHRICDEKIDRGSVPDRRPDRSYSLGFKRSNHIIKRVIGSRMEVLPSLISPLPLLALPHSLSISSKDGDLHISTSPHLPLLPHLHILRSSNCLELLEFALQSRETNLS